MSEHEVPRGRSTWFSPPRIPTRPGPAPAAEPPGAQPSDQSARMIEAPVREEPREARFEREATTSEPVSALGPVDQGEDPTRATAPVRHARIIAVANQKGGVGKSTTAVNVGACLAESGQRVLVVDLDPQGNASTGLGLDHASRGPTTYQVVVGGIDIHEAIIDTVIPGLSAVPSTIDLAGAEIELVSQFSREARLARALDGVAEEFDFILLDCPPSLGLLTVNALTAAQELIVPIQCEYYALEGLGQLLRNVRLVQQNVNPTLRLTGIVMTMFDGRTKLADQVVSEVRAYFGSRVYESVIPRSIRLAEAPGYGKPITQYDSSSKGAQAYRKLAQELLERGPETSGRIDDLEAMDLRGTRPFATPEVVAEVGETQAGSGESPTAAEVEPSPAEDAELSSPEEPEVSSPDGQGGDRGPVDHPEGPPLGVDRAAEGAGSRRRWMLGRPRGGRE
jgi:chromosome partitioning protein